MATSAFKSTTKRSSIGDSSRRSRSLSRFEPDDYNKNAPRGKFVNTTRGSTAPFPEISLDDLAIDFFSSSSSSSSKVVDREGRSVARWANDTASSSSRRKGGRSVSRTRGGDDAILSASRDKNVISSAHRRRSLSVAPYQISDSENVVEREGRSVSRRGEIGRWTNDTASSRRKGGRSVSRTRGGDAVSSSFVSSRGKNVISSAAVGSHRRRSLSVARYQISDSESEIDHSRSSSNRANSKALVCGNNQMTLATKATASSTRRLGRSRSYRDFSLPHDGYSSHSSILTDDEAKNCHIEKHGFEKIIREVSAKKTDHASGVVGNGELYETMQKELRYAVDEIRTELNQAMGRSQTSLTTGDLLQSEASKGLMDLSKVGDKYKHQLEKRKQVLLSEMLLEEQRGQDLSKMVKELPNSRTSATVDKSSRARKRSGDKNRMSERLIEEAERYFEDFICNVEDTDISSFDGERSCGSSTLGGTVKGRYAETCKTRNGYTTNIVEMDGVILPWLQWETSHDGCVSGRNKAHTPLTPKALQWDSEKEMGPLHDPSGNSFSSHGSWSPGVFNSPVTDKREDTYKTIKVDNEGKSCYDMDKYRKLGNNEELLFEMYRERNRISSGSLLLCTSVFY